MKYSNTTLRELKSRYKKVLLKCAFLNAAILIGITTISPVNAASITWDGTSGLEITSDDSWSSNKTQTIKGALSGSGTINSRPSGSAIPYKDSELTIESDISGFTGTFSTIQYSNEKGKPNAVSSIIFKNWNSSQGLNLQGNGNFIFSGNQAVKISSTSATSSGKNDGKIYLNGNTLTTDSSISGDDSVRTLVFLGGQNDNISGRDVTLSGYEKMDKADLYIGGSSDSTSTGALKASISNSAFNGIFGTMGKQVDGGIYLSLKDTVVNGYVVGQTGAASIYGGKSPTDSTVNGDITIVGDNLKADKVFGQAFYADGEKLSGINGNINISLTNSSVGEVRGANYHAGNQQEWNATYYNQAESINISVKDTVIKNELLSTGAYVSAGDVKITVSGNTLIGYDDEGNKTTGDGWIIAGAQRPGARISSTEINLNTDGEIKIAGDIQVGSREKPGVQNSDEGSVIGNATLNMLGGGTVNVGGTLRAYHVAGQRTLNMSNITANVGAIAGEFDTINLAQGARLTVADELNMANNSTLNVSSLLNGTIISAGSVVLGENVTLNADSLVVAGADEYTFIDSQNWTGDFTLSDSLKKAIDDNKLYDFSYEKGTLSITEKATETIAEAIIESGASAQEATAIATIAGVSSTDETANAVLSEISTALQTGDTQKATKIVKAINPEVAPVTRVATASNAVLGAVATRMSALGGAPAPAPTAAARGRSGGDVNVKLSPWVQGLYNKTHNSQGDGFNAYTQGFAFGADVDLTDAWTLGIGYAYTATDVKSDRKTQIYGDNVFAYAQYKPENWYVNAVASYGKSTYKQAGTFSAKYDAASYSAQALTGYDAGLFDTYTGIRYNYIKTDAYNNGIANIKSKNTQIGTFVLGTRISQDFQVKKGFSLTPEFRLAGTYDFKSDNAVSTVGIIGSTASYTVTGDRMSRGAIETGIGLTASVNNFELKFDYDAALRSENNTQSVNLKAIYHF